jgi:hypothetical protein
MARVYLWQERARANPEDAGVVRNYEAALAAAVARASRP